MLDRKEDWAAALEDARGYHQAALGGMQKPQVFVPELLYNIITMSAERYCMAVFYLEDRLPSHHMFTDMSIMLQDIFGGEYSDHFFAAMRELDAPMANLCSLSPLKPMTLSETHIERYLCTLDLLSQKVIQHLEERCEMTV